MVRAVRLLAEQMDDPDKLVARQAALEIIRLSTTCLRHGEGFPLDWADDSLDDELVRQPVRHTQEPEPVRDLPDEVEPDPIADENAEFTAFARSMGYDEATIALARRKLGLVDEPKTHPTPLDRLRLNRMPSGQPRPVLSRPIGVASGSGPPLAGVH